MGKKSRPKRLSMAGMIHDANQSLKWVMNDPGITEAFRNTAGLRTQIYERTSSFRKKRREPKSKEDIDLAGNNNNHNHSNDNDNNNNDNNNDNDNDNNNDKNPNLRTDEFLSKKATQPKSKEDIDLAGNNNNHNHSNDNDNNNNDNNNDNDNDNNNDNNNDTNNDNNNDNARMTSNKQSYASLFSDEEEPDLLGIGFFTVWEAGCVLSGYVGSGIVMSRNIVTGSWSSPVAVGISGVGAGLLVGVSARSLVYLIYDYFTLNSIIGKDTGGFIIGIGAGATIGSCCSKQIGPGATYITSPNSFQAAGIGSNVALSKGLGGLFVGVSIEGGFCRSRDRLNARFYGRTNLTGADILLSGEDIEIPNEDGKNAEAKLLLAKMHTKLYRLCSGDASTIQLNTTNIGLDIDASNNNDDDDSDGSNGIGSNGIGSNGIGSNGNGSNGNGSNGNMEAMALEAMALEAMALEAMALEAMALEAMAMEAMAMEAMATEFRDWNNITEADLSVALALALALVVLRW
eukprot:CAMPEP_0172409726 /NCGR_PEP_ID=MMETSP1061-20121228/76514_1 /TAXON_ID=37318 /ORGANISM="Pseudo-nitzschia pungens, Strain cf. pungens" /LENGTH=514 /DNA_ID=CAMNT_0013145891 /DNA_START=283 /DNA_END=1825 /DNA_ORIENTATION=-